MKTQKILPAKIPSIKAVISYLLSKKLSSKNMGLFIESYRIYNGVLIKIRQVFMCEHSTIKVFMQFCIECKFSFFLIY